MDVRKFGAGEIRCKIRKLGKKIGVGRNLEVQERRAVVALVFFAQVEHAVPTRTCCIVISTTTHF